MAVTETDALETVVLESMPLAEFQTEMAREQERQRQEQLQRLRPFFDVADTETAVRIESVRIDKEQWAGLVCELAAVGLRLNYVGDLDNAQWYRLSRHEAPITLEWLFGVPHYADPSPAVAVNP